MLMISFFKKKHNLADDSHEKIRLLSTSRIFIALCLLIATLLIHPGGRSKDLYHAFLFLTAIHLVISIFFFSFAFVLNPKSLYRFAFIQIAWDILFHTSMVYLTGGINSQFKFLYWLSIFFASIIFLRTGAFIAAGLCALSYAMLIDLEYFESLPKLYASFSHFSFSNEKDITYSIVLNSLVFFFIAYAASAITAKLHKTEQIVLEKERHVEDLERKVMQSKHLASVGEMAARIAHEIRNPLTSVSASMEMLSKKEEQGSNEMMILNIAKKEAKRLKQLLTDFLDYAQPSSPEFEEEYLSKLVEDSIQVFSHGYANVHFHFENQITSEKKIPVDTRMFSQLFWNILKNAAESMDENGKIDVLLSKNDKGQYMILVKDEGKGIDPSQKEKLFEPFYTSKPRGTGLGLSIAYRIMQDHEGTIELIPSNDNRGTVCKLTFVVG